MPEDAPVVGASSQGRPHGPGLETGGRTVPGEWIDYNGHMMDAYYSVAFTEATEALLDHLGLGASYRERAGCGIYTVESHICFRQSIRSGDRLRYVSQLLGHDTKRLHIFHRIISGPGCEVATNELMSLHVDLSAERVTGMPPDRWGAVSALASAHAGLPVPDQVGRGIAMPDRSRM